MTRRSLIGRDKRRYLLKSERAWHAERHAYLPELCDQLSTRRITRRDFLRQACLLGLGVGAASALAQSLKDEPLFAAPAAAQTPKQGGALRVSMRVQDMTDPATFAWPEKSNIARFIVEHLTRTRSDNVTVPYLAESWEASDDLTRWAFFLRQDVTWSNGDAFTAEDVAWSVNRWLDPATGSSNLGLFGAMVESYDTGEKQADGARMFGKRGIDGAVEIIDAHTIKFNLKQPVLAMPENFYNYPTAITHRSFGVDGVADLSADPIGTGCFELETFAVGEKAVLRKTRDWWAGEFHLDRIEYIDHGDDLNVGIAALIDDQVDMVYRLPIESIEQVERSRDLTLAPATTAQTALMRFRISEKPFDNKLLRQAVMACMDHEALTQGAFQARGLPAENHHVCPIHPEYAALPLTRRDIERAKALLNEAGYPDGIVLEITNGDTEGPWMTEACEMFRQQCAPAGIDVRVKKISASQYWRIWDSAPWGYTAWTHRPLGTMALSLAYRAGVPWNETAYDNPEFDAALDAAEAELDVAARRDKIKICQKMLQEDAIIPQPFWRTAYKAHAARVKGHETHPTFYHQFQDVWIDDA